jgi:hypothetical protein
MEHQNNVQIRKSLKDYPKFAAGVLLGLLIALITTPEGILFTLFGALLCWAIGIPSGLAIAVGLYTITFIIGKYVNGFMTLLNSKSSLFLRIITERHGRE